MCLLTSAAMHPAPDAAGCSEAIRTSPGAPAPQTRPGGGRALVDESAIQVCKAVSHASRWRVHATLLHVAQSKTKTPESGSL